jgi:LysR family nitrogen assimilation transcriptional regulator
MDTRQLTYFAAVCATRNLSRAANQCNVAQSAISHHIGRLEAELGTPLFTRKPRGMEPTAAGIQLLRHAKSILNAIEFARNEVQAGQRELVGDIAIGMPFSVIKAIGVSVMRAVRERHPRVRLLISESLSGVAFEHLLSSEVEFALIYNPPADERTERLALLQEEIFCIGRPSIVGTEATPITFKEFSALPIVLLKTGALSRGLMDRPGLLDRLGDKISLQLASVAATLGALQAGLGCTLAPKTLVREMLESGEFVARPLIEPKAIRTLYLVRPAGQEPTHLREAMMRMVRDLVKDAVDTGAWPECIQ